MALYLDTEFQQLWWRIDLNRAGLGSRPALLAPVRALPSKVHPWVAEHVVPFLLAEPMEDYMLRARLGTFLRQHTSEPIIADWPEDFVHLLYCLCEPGGISQNIELDMRLIQSGEIKPDLPHNALSDARALMHWHISNREAA